jgi:hypothetical protein
LVVADLIKHPSYQQPHRHPPYGPHVSFHRPAAPFGARSPKVGGHTARTVLLGILGIIVVIVAVTVAVSSAQSSNNATPGATTPSAGVSKGLGAHDASADVNVGALTWDSNLGAASVPVTVTNQSSKRSDYVITVGLETADGKVHLGSGNALVFNLEPGRSAPQTANFLGVSARPPAGAKVVLQLVQRTPSR